MMTTALEVLLTVVVVCNEVTTHNIPANIKNDFDIPERYRSFTNNYEWNGIRYKVLFPMTYEEAQMACRNSTRQLSRLAQIPDEPTASYIAFILADATLSLGLDAVWLGARICDKNDTTDGKFCWEELGLPPMHRNLTWETETGLKTVPWVKRSKVQEQANLNNRGCLAMTRDRHNNPLFVDLDCVLSRASICEDRILPSDNFPKHVGDQVIKTGRHEKGQYSLYLANFTWKEAAQYCMKKKMKIAVAKNSNYITELQEILLHKGPGLKQVWVNGFYVNGRLHFVRTNMYFFYNFPEDRITTRAGCLTIDRHGGLHQVYELRTEYCDKKLSFICERQLLAAIISKDPQFQQVNVHGDEFLILKKQYQWAGADMACRQLGATIAMPLNMLAVDVLATLMAESPDKPIKSIWLGATKNSLTNEWRWISGHEFSTESVNGYPPMWWNISTPMQHMDCLNMDGFNMHSSIWYQQWCGFKQNVICVKYKAQHIGYNETLDKKKVTVSWPVFLVSPIVNKEEIPNTNPTILPVYTIT